MPTHSRYWLTETRGGKTRRYQSGWRMTAEEAAKRGLTDADKVPGSEETRQEVRMQSAGHDGVKKG
jgi:hypothetical protein